MHDLAFILFMFPDAGMDEDELVADADHRGRAGRHPGGFPGSDDRVQRGRGGPSLLPRRDPHEDAQDAHPASHHLVHDFRCVIMTSQWLSAFCHFGLYS